MWRPRVEVPEFTRCCFCLPLRYGLLGLAYIKLVITSLVALLMTGQVVYIFDYAKEHNTDRTSTLVVVILVVVLIYLDILFTIMFIVTGHMKNRRGIQIYYYYTIVITIIYVIGSLATLISLMVRHYEYLRYAWVFFGQDLLMTASVTVLHIYMVLMMRSELRKLSNPANFRFVNHAAEQTQADKNDGDAILRQEREDTESRTEDVGLGYTY